MRATRDNTDRLRSNVSPAPVSQSSGFTVNGSEKAGGLSNESPITRWRNSRNAEGSASTPSVSSAVAAAGRVRTTDATAKSQEPSKVSSYSRKTLETSSPARKGDVSTSPAPSNLSKPSVTVNGSEKAGGLSNE
ncbi:uncharacterized protein TM35_000023670, partial [Trypanosoma theileri]